MTDERLRKPRPEEVGLGPDAVPDAVPDALPQSVISLIERLVVEFGPVRIDYVPENDDMPWMISMIETNNALQLVTVMGWLEDALLRNQIVHPLDRRQAESFVTRWKEVLPVHEHGPSLGRTALLLLALLRQEREHENRNP